MDSTMKELQSVFGADRVENALAGTPLADLGRKHNFGLYVVRKAITDEAAKTWMVQSGMVSAWQCLH